MKRREKDEELIEVFRLEGKKKKGERGKWWRPAPMRGKEIRKSADWAPKGGKKKGGGGGRPDGIKGEGKC